MNNLYRFCLLIIVAFSMVGCSSIHTSISPDRMQSELRAAVEAPFELAAADSPFCIVPEAVLAKVQPLVRIPAPYSAKLYFLLDQTVFTAESEVESKEVYQQILKRDPSDVIISGHTDTSASYTYNNGLSQRRSEKVKQDLINLGVSAHRINISSEGEYRLLVPTPDDTREVRNRRVEINLR